MTNLIGGQELRRSGEQKIRRTENQENRKSGEQKIRRSEKQELSTLVFRNLRLSWSPDLLISY
jgi:hypothetical protein